MPVGLNQLGGQANTSKPFGDPRSEFLHGTIVGRDSLAKNVAHFLFHAPAVPARATLQPRLHAVVEITHHHLSHAKMISRYHFRAASTARNEFRGRRVR